METKNVLKDSLGRAAYNDTLFVPRYAFEVLQKFD